MEQAAKHGVDLSCNQSMCFLEADYETVAKLLGMKPSAMLAYIQVVNGPKYIGEKMVFANVAHNASFYGVRVGKMPCLTAKTCKIVAFLRKPLRGFPNTDVLQIRPLIPQELFNIMGLPLFGKRSEAFPWRRNYVRAGAAVADHDYTRSMPSMRWYPILGNALSADAFGTALSFFLGNLVPRVYIEDGNTPAETPSPVPSAD